MFLPQTGDCGLSTLLLQRGELNFLLKNTRLLVLLPADDFLEDELGLPLGLAVRGRGQLGLARAIKHHGHDCTAPLHPHPLQDETQTQSTSLFDTHARRHHLQIRDACLRNQSRRFPGP